MPATASNVNFGSSTRRYSKPSVAFGDGEAVIEIRPGRIDRAVVTQLDELEVIDDSNLARARFTGHEHHEVQLAEHVK